MPRIKRTDCASCEVPGIGRFDEGDSKAVSRPVADMFRGARGWEVIEDSDSAKDLEPKQSHLRKSTASENDSQTEPDVAEGD